MAAHRFMQPGRHDVPVDNRDERSRQPGRHDVPVDNRDPRSRQPGRHDYQGENDVEICIFNLRGKCSYKTNCTRIHAPKPYLWQYKLGDNWVTFSHLSHGELQLNYSDPSNDECQTTVNLDTTSRRSNAVEAKVNFEKMVMTESSTHQEYKIRHFSTKSYALAPPTHIFVTKWCWYWLDKRGAWHEYGEQATSTASPKSSIAKKTSKEIEECFMEDPQGSMQFKAQAWKYSISFSEMQQNNLSTGTTRKTRRRPVFPVEDGSRKPQNELKRGQSESSASADKSTSKQSSTQKLGPETALSFPPHWDVTYVDPVSNDADCQLVPITNSGDSKAEFDKLEKQFMETMSDRKLKSIKRIQNTELWEKYCLRKTWMEKKLVAGQTVKEKLLFHGTKACFTKAVYTQGLDWRLAGTSTGAIFGKGSYFSKSAKYSSCYTDNNALFMVQVLVGESTQGQGSYVRPPPKDPATKPYENFYDSCVDNVQNPSMYIIFKDEQMYPAYLLEY